MRENLNVATRAPQGKEGEKTRAKVSADNKRLLAQAPDDPLAHSIQAQTDLATGDRSSAASHADTAVKLAAPNSPEFFEATRTRAVARWHVGDFPGAMADAQTVLKADPKDPVATAVANLSINRVPGQIKVPGAGGAGAEEMNLPELSMLSGHHETGNRKEDVKKAKEFLEKGEKALAEGKYSEMHRFASVSLSLVPDNPQAYVQRAFANLFLKRFSGMVADATLGLALSPDSPELLGLRARGYNELGNYAAAFADADRAISLNARHAMGWSERARAREGLRQPAAAWLEDYKRAAELQPAWSNLYDAALARSQAQAGMKALSETASPWKDPKLVVTGLAVVGVLAVFLVAMFSRTLGETSPAPRGPSLGPPAPEAPAVAKGERYAFGRVLGQGGMGKVFEARDTLLSRPVAIKQMRTEIRSNPDDLRRFLEEAKTVASLAHPNIVAIYDIVEAGPWLVFELVRGSTLQQAIDAAPGRKLDAATVKRVVEQACSALDHAHERRVVHRDLKPSNIMLNDGQGVKVMDFGISRVAKDSLMKTTATIAGTPLYMAPEQETGKSQRETDLYALGVCAFEMLAGFMPFQGPAQLDLKRQGRMTRSGMSPAFDAFFARALDPDPARRFHTGAEFHAAFLALR